MSAGAQGSKGKKRAREEGRDVSRFLSLEAEVSDISDEDDDFDDEELEEFLEDSEPVAADRSVSHRLLFSEHARVQTEVEWESLLARARERGKQDYTRDSPHVDGRLPFVGDVRLWRVSVRPGCEETATFVLMEKLIRRGPPWTITSIIGRVSRPGWIVIEASQASDVRAICQGVSNVFHQQIHVVDPEDAPSCLREQILFTPRPHSWVRLAKHPYKGDLAYVRQIDANASSSGSGVSLLVVPRLNLQRRTPGQPKKRQRGRRDRPDQALFDASQAREIWGQNAVTTRNHALIFKGKQYLDGYLCIETDDFYPEEATPTAEEIVLFQHLFGTPRDFFQHTLELMAAQRLCIGDPVKVIEGQAQGTVGFVENIIGQEAILRISPGSSTLALPITALRKSVRLGDEVIIVFGPRTGVTGWVVSISGEKLVLYNHKTAEEVETASHCVNFWQAPFQVGSSLPRVETQDEIDRREKRAHTLTVAELETHGALQPAELQDEIDKLRRDPNRHLIGRHVQVIGRHRYKGLVGTVTSTKEHDHLLVEMNFDGMMLTERLHISNLASFDDPEKKTLGQDPRRHLIGRHIRVIQHRLKDYEGIIKSTQQDDHVLVEIQATMQQERIPLRKLVFLDDRKMKPLGKQPPDMSPAASTSRRTMEIPESTLPLIPSTPLPPTSGEWMSPAWDPSSRTPDPNTPFTQNPWMQWPWFAGKRIKLQIRDTQPVLRDPGWKYGDYEDRFGLWSGTEGPNVKVVLGLHNTVLLPEKYVRTVPPSLKGQSVIVLEGASAGQEYYVATLGQVECVVGRRRNGRIDPKSKLTFPTSNLAVIA